MQAQSPRLIRKPEALRRTGYSNTRLFHAVKDGSFPQPVKIGSRAIAFVESEVDEFITAMIAASRNDSQAA